MIDPVKLMDVFTASIVAIGLGMGGTGLAMEYVFTSDEDKTLLQNCLPEQNGRIFENTECNALDLENAYKVHNRLETANSLAMGGLFTVLAGGMIGGTAGYARAFQRKMNDYKP